jgi:hypothetical protein
MKRLILMVASLAVVLVTGAAFVQADQFRPDISERKEHRLEEGRQVQYSGHVRGVDMRAGVLLLRREAGGVISLKAPREKLARLAHGDKIQVTVRRSPDGIDHVLRMWKVVEERGNLEYQEM